MKPLALWNAQFSSPLKSFFDSNEEFERSFRALETGFTPACDIEESNSQFVLSFDLPGISKDDVKIEIHDQRLSVSGERKWESRSDNGSKHSIEKAYGNFQRTFTLPASVDAEKVEAKYENGILKLTLPKTEVAKPRQIRVS